MTTKEEYLLHSWPKQRAKGKPMYMVYHALIYALLVGVISLLFRTDEGTIQAVILSKEFLIKLALFTAIGAVMANYKWKANNKKYEELQRQSGQNNS